jgi:hypothetical protein
MKTQILEQDKTTCKRIPETIYAAVQRLIVGVLGKERDYEYE